MRENAPMTPRLIMPGEPAMAEVLHLIRDEFACMDGVIDPPYSMHHLTQEALCAGPGAVWAMGDPVIAASC